MAGQHEVLTHVFQTDDGALPQDKKVFPREKNDSIDEAESLERHERKLSRGERLQRPGAGYQVTPVAGRRPSRKRTLSKERRQSLLFEDQMATYCYVEVAEDFTPASKSSAGLGDEAGAGQTASLSPGPSKLPSSNSLDCPAAGPSPSSAASSSPHWSLATTKPTFMIRVPNESIIRLFSFLVRITLDNCVG